MSLFARNYSAVERRIQSRIDAIDEEIARCDENIAKYDAEITLPAKILAQCKKEIRMQGCREPLALLDDCLALDDPSAEEARGALRALSDLFLDRLDTLPCWLSPLWYDTRPIRAAMAKLEGVG